MLLYQQTPYGQIEPNWTEPQTCLACQNHASTLKILTPIPYQFSKATTSTSTENVAVLSTAMQYCNINNPVGQLQSDHRVLCTMNLTCRGHRDGSSSSAMVYMANLHALLILFLWSISRYSFLHIFVFKATSRCAANFVFANNVIWMVAVSDDNQRITRSSQLQTQQLVTYRIQTPAPLTWNSLPPAVLNCKSFSTFKSRLKTRMFYTAFC